MPWTMVIQIIPLFLSQQIFLCKESSWLHNYYTYIPFFSYMPSIYVFSIIIFLIVLTLIHLYQISLLYFFSTRYISHKLSTYAIHNSVQCVRCFKLTLGLLSSVILNYLFLLHFLKQSFARMVICYFFFQPADSSSRLSKSIIKAPLIYLVCLLLKGCFIVMFLFNYLLKLSQSSFFRCLYYSQYTVVNVIGLSFI